MAVIALTAVAVFGGGCRRPDPVYDRVPRPIGTRDIVRAERRDGTPLSEPERLAVQALHDRYLAGFDAFREAELIPFAADYRTTDVEAVRNDQRRLRALINRHVSIMNRIEALDESFYDDVASALGDDRERFIACLRSRRALDRASALSVGDGGRVLIDLRQLLDRFDLDESDRAMVEPILQAFDAEASMLAGAIADEQATLPLSHLAVLERRGPASNDVDRTRSDEERKRAHDRAEWERFAESRKDLEILLGRYADLVDRSVENLAPVLEDEEAALLRRRLLQSRVDDDASRLGDPSLFQALVAARTQRVPKEVRDTIEAMRAKFLGEDEERLRTILDFKRRSHVPGVFDPIGKRDGPGAMKEFREREAAAVKARNDAAKRFREEFMALLPEDVRDELEALRGKTRDELTNALAELVGPGRVAALVQIRPRGFGDRDPQSDEQRQPESRDPGELRMMLAAAPDARAIERLLLRSGVSGTSAVVVDQIVTSWRPRWEATREPGREKIQRLMAPIMVSMTAGDAKAFDSAAQRLIGGFEELRGERQGLDADLLASIEAALPEGLTPAARTLWVWERSEASRRLRWRDLPFEGTLRLPPEATIPFMDLIGETLSRAPTPAAEVPARALAIEAALAPYIERLDLETEAMRDAALVTVRKAMTLLIEGRLQGMSEEQALSESRPEVRRAIAPLRSVAESLAAVRLEALAAVVAAVPPEEGRGLREAFVRAAYPRLLDERRSAERALAALRTEPLLAETDRATLEEILEERGRARDAALDALLDWANEWRTGEGPLGNEVGGRDVASRRHPQLAGVFFAREEADARAIRAALGLLDSDARLRHRDLIEYFSDPPATGRWLD
jgi:hypothetical protein